jgi:hypothetical protein
MNISPIRSRLDRGRQVLMERLDRIAEQQAIGEGSTALLEITYLEDELTHIQSLYETMHLDAIKRCWFPTAT